MYPDFLAVFLYALICGAVGLVLASLVLCCHANCYSSVMEKHGRAISGSMESYRRDFREASMTMLRIMSSEQATVQRPRVHVAVQTDNITIKTINTKVPVYKLSEGDEEESFPLVPLRP